jgi:tRNA threonylcarbamoyladenosine biosynthesis protein TsaB
MKILALEFSSGERSVAVLEQDERSQASLEFQRIESGTGRTLDLIAELLRESKVPRADIEIIAVGLGPGSYAGIRGAIALAQGWELGRAVRLLGISSVDCIAGQAAAEGMTGNVAVTIDAQRGEFYLANYELSPSTWRETKPLRLTTKQTVADCQANGDLVIGPEVAPIFPGSRLVWPRAALLARMASQRTDFMSGQELQPLYLRETNFVKAPPSRPLPE